MHRKQRVRIAETVGESSASGEESILGNLSPISGDTSSMDTEEFDRKLKEFGGGEEPEVASTQPKQVVATLAALDQRESEDEITHSDPQPSHAGSPLSRERPHKEVLSPEELVEQAGMDAIAHSDILNKPITPEDAANAEVLEAKRQEMLATAKKFATTAAAMLDERKEAANFVDNFLQRECQVDESLAKVKQLRKHWEDKITEAQQEADRIRREAVAPRKITFATPTEQQPFTTPKDNMKKVVEILKKKDEEIDIDYVRMLVASAMKQQSKADTSRRLESNPDHCISTAQKDAYDNHHRDDESRTGSSECRRKTREHPNPIPVPSKTPPSDPKKGKDAMYTGRDKYRNPSPPPKGYPRPPLPRRRRPAGNIRPHGPGGINIRNNAPPPRNENKERTPEPRRSRNTDREPEPRRSRNEERDPEPRRSRNNEGSQHHGPARIWLSDLEKNSICWFDLKTAFEKHFRAITPPPMTTLAEISQLQQSPSISRRRTVIAVTAAALSGRIPLMTRRVADPRWSPRLSNAEVQEAEEAAVAEAQPAGASSVVTKIQASPEAPLTRQRRQGKNKDKEEDSSEAMDEDDASPDPKEGSAAKSNPFGKKSVGAYHTFLGNPTVRASKSAFRIVNATVPAMPQYVRWSEIPCTFDRQDHPTIVPKEFYALVVSPRIDGCDFSKCLMDGGASLNIMYLETLERMNLTKEHLKHSTTEFHGVVPSSYHVIFGRPTYHKFHARACYIYNKLKIPGPNGMITVSGDYKKAHECELGEAAFAESVISGEELKSYRATVDPKEMHITKKQISEQKTSFKAAIETKKIDFKEGDTTKQPSDMSGVPRELAEHYLNIKPGAKPVKQAMRCFGDKKRRAIGMELAKFVSRPGEKALPLYKLLKKTDKFVWDDAEDAALQGLTEILTSPPILAAPEESEPMLLYLAATNRVISLVIVVERQEEGHEYGVQRPVYYISEVLTESKQRYPHFQKLAYGVFLGSRKLRHYFQEHPTVVSKAPLSTILNNADATGRTAKWGIELSASASTTKPDCD
ncbi:hypothetical protein QYE76_058198 [Lolium multiflorum]|uniref:Reverse transcriptase/retrotransposon-derived protein RNase H-like domain-containing protein n=1 Tax=Lolium multiflorum TaxID=4521 RepID=A0AAD8T5R7_LOLMU|nr:hypothetical protein QYE76_058198 [Lolium multiflorum]